VKNLWQLLSVAELLRMRTLFLREFNMELMSSSCRVQLWQRSLDVYREVIEAADDNKTKRKRGATDDTDTLKYLDKWYQDELPVIVKSRGASSYHLTRDELCQLMKWKLTRGKYRPRLLQLVKENDPSLIVRVTSEAYGQMPHDMVKAMDTLIKLRGIGPATASAILCVVYPEQAPFMSDESTLAVLKTDQLKYSLDEYMTYASALRDKAKELGDGWTAHMVELALWSYHTAKLIKPKLLHIQPAEDHDDSNDDSPPTKKHKI
jgi:hypothetical protein